MVFADCDGTLESAEIRNMTAPLESGNVDLVLGRRVRVERGVLPIHQRVGNAVACFILQRFYGLSVRDIPPYRAALWPFLSSCTFSEKTYGFPIETVALAVRKGGRVEEVDVTYRRRLAGRSKVAGSVTSSLRAAVSMITVLVSLRYGRKEK